MDIKISIGADYGGFEIKQLLKDWLNSELVIINDFGTMSHGSVDILLLRIKLQNQFKTMNMTLVF